MNTGKLRTTLRFETPPSRIHTDWYSAPRQAERDVVRKKWARRVLEEERMHPSTHSAARVRRARNILAALPNDQPE